MTDECPAGGEHTWGEVEELGTGRVAIACVECGKSAGSQMRRRPIRRVA